MLCNRSPTFCNVICQFYIQPSIISQPSHSMVVRYFLVVGHFLVVADCLVSDEERSSSESLSWLWHLPSTVSVCSFLSHSGLTLYLFLLPRHPFCSLFYSFYLGSAASFQGHITIYCHAVLATHVTIEIKWWLLLCS